MSNSAGSWTVLTFGFVYFSRSRTWLAVYWSLQIVTGAAIAPLVPLRTRVTVWTVLGLIVGSSTSYVPRSDILRA